MSGKNQFSADNQQENQVWWIVGFVDGEGTFSVSLNRNQTTSSGWQVFPEFVVSQGGRSRAVLEEIKFFFGCGEIYENRRRDNHRENIYRYCVRSVSLLNERIIPFFKEHPLKTAKRFDFEQFVRIIDLMVDKRHLTPQGRQTIAEIISTMNHRRPIKNLESSETTRQTSRAEKKI